MITQRFSVAMATDGDVTATEIRECLDALGFHGVIVIEPAVGHEHPCPTATGCLDEARAEGHIVLDDPECCVCWALGK